MRKKSERGAAAVEFAIVLPVLALFILGSIDWGYYFFVQQIAVNAAREGARAGSLHPASDPDEAALEDAKLTAENYLTSAGLKLVDAAVVPSPGVGSVIVQVSYRTGSLTGYAVLNDLLPTHARATAEMRR